MDKNALLALYGIIQACTSTGYNLFEWHLWVIDCYKDCLDATQHYDTLKQYQAGRADLEMYMADLYQIYRFAAGSLNKAWNEPIKKGLQHRPADYWDVDMINEIVTCMDRFYHQLLDLNELLADAPAELAGPAKYLASAPEKVLAFKAGALTDICRAMDESNVLALTDRTLEISTSSAEDESDDDDALKLALSADADFTPEQVPTFKKWLKRLLGMESAQPVEKAMSPQREQQLEDAAVDFRSALRIQKADPTIKGPQNLPFVSSFVAKTIDKDLGEATGIVMPAGHAQRRYLDGDYFPDDVVRGSMIGWILNTPQINRHHEESDLFNFWEHPHFRVIETWQERTGFMLGGEMVQPGDWVATIRAISPEAKEALMSGHFNGFSVEGWVTYFPDELLVTD